MRSILFRFWRNSKTVREVATLAIILLLLGASSAHAIASQEGLFHCFKQAIQRFLGKSSAGLAQVPARDHVFQDFEDLLSAFSNGLVPDLSVPSQRQAFELYRTMRLGDPATPLNLDTTDVISKALRTHPELVKESFRDFALIMEDRSYPVTKDLAAFLDSQLESAKQVHSNLFQIEANSGYWKKVFQFAPDEGQPLRKLSRDATEEEKARFREMSRKQKEMAQMRWQSSFNQALPTSLRAQLLSSETSPKERATALFHVLKKARAELLALGKDIKPISQAMTDLIHTIGYHDSIVTTSLKSNDGFECLNAYRKILHERDLFAMELGYDGHFEHAFREIAEPVGILMPTGVPFVRDASKTLQKLEKEVLAGSKSSGNGRITRKVRHLSLLESPYRSCLGGSDCSSRTYLTKALDPNYHYFTMTDPSTGISSGHITVVLGNAMQGETPVKTAFIDKIQNVPNRDLPVMIEAVRRSVEERGYRLALPDEMGEQNGISNEETTRKFVERSITTDAVQRLLSFKPHPHSYEFPSLYSRAYDALPMHAITPASLPENVSIAPGDLQTSWKLSEKTKHIDIRSLIQASIQLKNSSKLQDRLRYLPTMKALSEAKLTKDPEMGRTLSQWIQNENEPMPLRKQALLFRWSEESVPLAKLLPKFNEEDRVQIFQNLVDTPRHFKLLQKRRNEMRDLFPTERNSPKMRSLLARMFLPDSNERLVSAVEHVIHAPDVSNDLALNIIQFIQESEKRKTIHSYEGNLIDAESLKKLGKMVKGTSLENSFIDDIFQAYLSNSPDFERVTLAYYLENCLRPEYFSTIRELMTHAKEADPDLFQNDHFLNGVLEILNFNSHKDGPIYFYKQVTKWLSQSNASSESKVQFVRALSEVEARNPSSILYKNAYDHLTPQEQKLLQ